MAKRPPKSGRQMKEKKEFDEEVLQVDRVTRVVKGGRRLRFRTTVIIGNKKGKVGMGIGKAGEVAEAIKKAVAKAKKSLIEVPIVDNTIPFPVKLRKKSAELILLPASDGTGIKAGSAIRKILHLAGVNNVLSKSFGTRNRLNLSKATFAALEKLRSRKLYNTKNEEQESGKQKNEEIKKESTTSNN
jgi:small subunit ribosomal protein S5